ncbi:hypothetical protein GCM10022213_18070 [Parerythrobacter jejuensis]
MQAVGPFRLVDCLADGVGEPGNRVHCIGDRCQPGAIKGQPIEQRLRKAARASSRDILLICFKNLRGLPAQRGGCKPQGSGPFTGRNQRQRALRLPGTQGEITDKRFEFTGRFGRR